MSAGLPPAPVLLPVAALVTLAFLGDHPLVLLAVLVVAGVALRAAGGSRLAWIAGAASGIGIALIGPFAGPNGNVILIDGPSSGVIDLQVTAEEVGYGLAAGMRLCAVIWLAAAALAALDPDRLHARATRLAPHSALLVALGARLLPLLRSDARAVGDAARLRGIAPAGGRGPTAVRRAARLYLPLLATSLERGLDQGEALAARGFGHRRIVSLPERPLDIVERGAALLGAGRAGRGHRGGPRRRPRLHLVPAQREPLGHGPDRGRLGDGHRRGRLGPVAEETAVTGGAELRGVSYSYPAAAAPTLDGVDLSVRAGEIVLLAGPSGGGKSTILRVLGGLVPHFHGGVVTGRGSAAGLDLARARPAEIAGRIGVLFQEPETQGIFSRVVRDVAFSLQTRGFDAGSILPRAEAALAEVGAAHLADRRLEELSSGERQRAALAAVLAAGAGPAAAGRAHQPARRRGRRPPGRRSCAPWPTAAPR